MVASEMNSSPVDALLGRLEVVKPVGANKWMARCPAHEDHNPSLSIACIDDGRVLVKCFAGCSAAEIVAAVRLKLTDLMPPRSERYTGNGMTKTKAKRIFSTAHEAVAELERHHGTRSYSWIYLNASGEPCGVVVRWDRAKGKEIRPVSRNGVGWLIGGMAVPRPLYCLPDLLKSSGPVFVCEGEKAADALRSIGLLATTSPHGAKSYAQADWTPLADRDVIILPDHDAAGSQYADSVAVILGSLRPPARAKVLELTRLFPPMPTGGDAVDFIEARRAAGMNHADIRAEIERAVERQEWLQVPAPGSRIRDERPRILITTEEHEVNDQAVAALTSDHSVFQRGGTLVRIVREEHRAGGVMWSAGPRIDVLPRELLRERLTAAAHWIKETRDGGIRDAHPPGWCVSAVHARAVYPKIRLLYAVIDHPVMRPDGTILTTNGYDPATGLYLDMGTESFTVPATPSHSQVQSALHALFDIVQDFPFAADIHKSAWLAALLTPLTRFAFDGPAPVFLCDANVRAAGKGLLLDCISEITTGRRFTVATYTHDEDELRKRITSLALAGDRVVLFDNLDGRFGNATLDAALTGTSWKDRILGANRIATTPLYVTWFATGNNVAVMADTARRICHIRLDSDLEHPELRSGFRHPDLLAYVRANRPHLLSAALTILRGYCAAGRPDMQVSAWGSYKDWSDLVRAAVIWAGMPDPAETRLELQERADVTADYMGLILAGLEQLDPDRRGMTAAEIIAKAKEATALSPELNDLRDAIEGLVGKLEARTLGNRLRNFRRRIFAGRYLDVANHTKRKARWAVYPASEFSGGKKNTHQTHHTHHDSGEFHGHPGECGESSECSGLGWNLKVEGQDWRRKMPAR